jgi:hypothetical protein
VCLRLNAANVALKKHIACFELEEVRDNDEQKQWQMGDDKNEDKVGGEENGKVAKRTIENVLGVSVAFLAD